MKKFISLMLMIMIITSFVACTKPKSQEDLKTESSNNFANNTYDTTTNSTNNRTASSEVQSLQVNGITLCEYETVEATVAHVQNFYKNTKYTASNLKYTNIYSLHNHGGITEKWVDFEWKYSADLNVKSAQFLLSTNKDMKNATVSDVRNQETKFSVANLYTDTYYYWQVKVITTDGKVLTSKIAKTKTNAGKLPAGKTVKSNFLEQA